MEFVLLCINRLQQNKTGIAFAKIFEKLGPYAQILLKDTDVFRKHILKEMMF